METLFTKKTKTRAPHAGANARLHLENSMLKKGNNFVQKNWRIISPTGMGPLLIVNKYSEFQVNIFSNYRDIIEMSKFSYAAAAARAMTIHQCFLRKQPS